MIKAKDGVFVFAPFPEAHRLRATSYTELLLARSIMPDVPLPQSSLILYQTEDGRTRVQCRFEDESIWLTQAQIAELFQTTPQNVTLHLKAIFAEGELD